MAEGAEQVDGVDMATVAARCWRRHSTVGDVEADTTSVRALKTEHGSVVVVIGYQGTVADVDDGVVMYERRASQWACPGGGW